MILIKPTFLLLTTWAFVSVAYISIPVAEDSADALTIRRNELHHSHRPGENTGSGGNGNNNGNNGSTNNGGTNDNGSANPVLTLDPHNVQDASQSTGQDGSAQPGQSPSLTDPANFINFCQGKTLTNGQQDKGGSCNGIVMGDIPAADKMVSTIIISPKPGEDIPANTPFSVQLQIDNLEAGSFTNPTVTYYAAPQALAGSGKVIGHCHVTIQDLGSSLTPNSPPDAGSFAFFQGINDAGNEQGLLSAEVTNGLPAGFYRVCSMNSASNHQPVIMPVAQRGAQDDCTKFTVGQSNNNNNNGNDNNRQNGSNRGQRGGRKERRLLHRLQLVQ